MPSLYEHGFECVSHHRLLWYIVYHVIVVFVVFVVVIVGVLPCRCCHILPNVSICVRVMSHERWVTIFLTVRGGGGEGGGGGAYVVLPSTEKVQHTVWRPPNSQQSPVRRANMVVPTVTSNTGLLNRCAECPLHMKALWFTMAREDVCFKSLI